MSDSDDDFQPDPRSRSKPLAKKTAALQSIPTGHCLVNPRWRNTITGQNISKLSGWMSFQKYWKSPKFVKKIMTRSSPVTKF